MTTEPQADRFAPNADSTSVGSPLPPPPPPSPEVPTALPPGGGVPPAPLAASIKRPRIWPVFVGFAATVVVLILGQAVVGVGIALWSMSRGATPGDIMAKPLEGIPPQLLMILMYLPVAVASIGVALAMRPLLGGSLRDSFGLGRPQMPRWGYALLLLGTWVPFAVAIGCAALAASLGPTQEGLEAIWAPGPAPLAIAYVLFIAFAPGFAEEFFFRGFMQQQLLRRWSPWVAILVTSIFFALLHVMPPAMALAFPLGIWLGVLAWRTGSIWPGVFCHAIINGVWNALQIFLHRNGPVTEMESPTAVEWAVFGVLGAVSLAAFVLCIVMLARIRPQAQST